MAVVLVSCMRTGKEGHISKDCWEKEENADKRPKGWKSQGQGQHASAAMDQDSGTEVRVEFLLNALTFPNNPQLLNDPHVWIADSCATHVSIQDWYEKFM
jgi:hypothetical protein